MQVRVAESRGMPVPQFVITAQSETERVLLSHFASCAYDSHTYKFHFHGATYQSGVKGARSFNFGLIHVPKPKRLGFWQRIWAAVFVLITGYQKRRLT